MFVDAMCFFRSDRMFSWFKANEVSDVVHLVKFLKYYLLLSFLLVMQLLQSRTEQCN